MPAKKNKRNGLSARKLAGAVVLTASFSLFAIPDALAESGGCLSISGAMDGSDIFGSGGGGCSPSEASGADRTNNAFGY